MALEIELTRGGITTLVDEEDYAELMQFTWTLHSTGRASRKPPLKEDPRRKQILMHRQIMGFPSGLDVDHINGNPLDNRRCNLRAVTRSENLANAHARRGGSKYKGVSWHRYHQQWGACITFKGKARWLGYYPTAEDAARAYDAAAPSVFGLGVSLNFSDVDVPQSEAKCIRVAAPGTIQKCSSSTAAIDCSEPIRQFLRTLGHDGFGKIGKRYGEIWTRKERRKVVAVGSSRESVDRARNEIQLRQKASL